MCRCIFSPLRISKPGLSIPLKSECSCPAFALWYFLVRFRVFVPKCRASPGPRHTHFLHSVSIPSFIVWITMCYISTFCRLNHRFGCFRLLWKSPVELWSLAEPSLRKIRTHGNTRVQIGKQHVWLGLKESLPPWQSKSQSPGTKWRLIAGKMIKLNRWFSSKPCWNYHRETSQSYATW